MISSSKNNWFDYIESKTTNYSYLNIIPEELKIYKFQDHFYNFFNKLRSSLNSKRNSTKLTTISATDPNGRITDLVNSNIPEIQLTSDDRLQSLKYLKDNELSKYEDIIYTIQNDSIPLNSFDNVTNRMLHYSMEYGYTDLVKWLLNNGADPNYTNELGNQPIHSAVSRKHVQILQLLIDFGAKVDAKNRLGAQAIHLACEADFVEGLELLLEIAVDANTPDEQGATPVHYCCFNDSAACLQMLIQAGGNIYQTDALGKYPIHEAISQSSLQCLKILLDYNQYDMQARNEPTTTITEPSCQIINSMITNTENHKSISVFSRKYSTSSNKFNSGSKNLTNSFELEMRQEKLNQRMRKPFKKQQLIHLRDGEGLAPIHAAASSGSIELLNICLQYNPDVLAKDQNGQTVLHYAALRGDLECVKAIIKNISLEEQTKLIHCSNENQETCLHLAAKHNFVDMVDYLISLGSNINQQDINGYTPIMSAAIKGSINLKELPELLNDVDNYGYTPLHYATKLGLIETCLFFLRYGANVTVVGENKCTPLHLAAKFGRSRISQIILTTIGGMRTLSMTDSKGCLPLHIAAYYGQDKLLELFLKNGCLFRRCHEGNTALHYAVMQENVEACRILLEINPTLLNQTNYDGMTALHIAAIRNNSRTIEYLLSNGAEIKPDHNGLYFSNYAITRQNEAAVKEIVLHERWPEIVELLSNTIYCPFKELIKYLPEICLTLFDFSILQPPLKNRNRQPTEPLQHLKLYSQTNESSFNKRILIFILFVSLSNMFTQCLQIISQVFNSLSDNNKIQFRNCFIEYTSSLNHSMNNITKINRKQFNMLSNIGLTFFDTLMMMMGEYKRTKIIIQSYLEDQVSAIPYPKLTFIFYIAFIILIPITLISLTIGLAVGDIDKARRSATQELIYRQVYWLDSLEANLPRWLYAKICVQKWLLKPARPNVPRTEYNQQKIGMVQLSIASNHAKAINTNNGNTIGYWKLR
ncbi:transient receptor potential cation channel subfamily A member 1 [Schistosoma bovis]|uniref:Transient receptor potential cation channel subfamily A member 1 n=1 Tax=Schistosoma bovis TaxID=6184 RepID=A0A430Q844_SCHBO|nr:transient receptor potential cation channel subfamily A member 1 [Schistosoma bovis]